MESHRKSAYHHGDLWLEVNTLLMAVHMKNAHGKDAYHDDHDDVPLLVANTPLKVVHRTHA